MTIIRHHVTERIKIYRRGKKGTWTAEFRLHGEHQRRSLKTRNKKVAEQRARDLDRDLDDGILVPTARAESLALLIQKFITFKRDIDEKKLSTVREYKRELTRWADALAEKGVRTLTGITPRVEDDYLLDRSKTLSQRSRRACLTIHNVFLNWCASRRYVRHNPLAGMRLARPAPRPTRPADLRLIKHILRGEDQVFAAIIATLAFTGMRVGELRHLRRQDVDPEGSWIHVTSRDDWTSKTGPSRKIPIHEQLRPHLQLLLKSFRRGSYLVSGDPCPRSPEGGHPINAQRLKDRFQAVAASLGYPVGRQHRGLVLHSLRHFFRSHCTNAGIPERVVDVWMGHVGRQDTGRIYYHLTDDESQTFMASVPFNAHNRAHTPAPDATDGAAAEVTTTPQTQEDES